MLSSYYGPLAENVFRNETTRVDRFSGPSSIAKSVAIVLYHYKGLMSLFVLKTFTSREGHNTLIFNFNYSEGRSILDFHLNVFKNFMTRTVKLL